MCSMTLKEYSDIEVKIWRYESLNGRITTRSYKDRIVTAIYKLSWYFSRKRVSFVELATVVNAYGLLNACYY